MTLPRFEYFAPESLEEALNLLSETGNDAYLLAGGTDLLVRMNQGLLKPKTIIALKQIEGLDKITFRDGEGLTIGATALLAEVLSHPDILKHYPSIAYAAGRTANVQIRNMGTVVGNLCNAAPSADNAPTLIAMRGEAVLRGLKGERRIPLDQFFKGPGLTAREPGEIMTAVFVPLPPPHSGTSYKNLSARGQVDISAVSAGVMVTADGEVCREARIVLGSVAPIPMRAIKAENLVRGKALTQEVIQEAGDQASEESRPISDVRSSADYRKKIVGVLTRRALQEAWEKALNR